MADSTRPSEIPFQSREPELLSRPNHLGQSTDLPIFMTSEEPAMALQNENKFIRSGDFDSSCFVFTGWEREIVGGACGKIGSLSLERALDLAVVSKVRLDHHYEQASVFQVAGPS